MVRNLPIYLISQGEKKTNRKVKPFFNTSISVIDNFREKQNQMLQRL